MNYSVNEIFHSIQGEGWWAGMPATFIRLQGCTVGCPWCDTKYTWAKGGSRMNEIEIVSQIKYKHVVITGGEPTIYNLDALMNKIWEDSSHYIQLETSGQNELRGALKPNWITWSPKRNLAFKCSVIMPIIDEVKWVVDSDLLLRDVFDALDWVVPRVITFMPEGFPPTRESRTRTMLMLTEFIERAPSYKAMYSDRLQCILEVK